MKFYSHLCATTPLKEKCDYYTMISPSLDTLLKISKETMVKTVTIDARAHALPSVPLDTAL